MSSFSSSSSASISSAELLSSNKKTKGGLYNKRDKKTNQNTTSVEETSADLGDDVPSGMETTDCMSEVQSGPAIRKSGGFSFCEFLGKPRWFVTEFQSLQRDLLLFFRKIKDMSSDEAKSEFSYMDFSFFGKM